MDSSYVHSSRERWEDENLVDLVSDFEPTDYMSDAIAKLEKIRDQLKNAEDEFLGGYSLPKALEEAQDLPSFIVRLANEIIYGSSAEKMSAKLSRNKNIYKKGMSKMLENRSGDLANEVTKILNIPNLTVSTFVNKLLPQLTKGKTEITVSEGNAIIQELGDLLNVTCFKSQAREAEIDLNKAIFSEARQKIHGGNLQRNGVFKTIMTDLILNSNAVTTQRTDSAIDSFTKELKKEMLEKIDKKTFSVAKPEDIIKGVNEFILALNKGLKEKYTQGYTDKGNVRGIAIGEIARTEILEAAGSTIVSFRVGNRSEEQFDDARTWLKEQGYTGPLEEMVSYHEKGKESMSDLIFYNKKTGKIARVQSKNQFFSAVTSGGVENDFNNFRTMIEKDTNLIDFLIKLSSINSPIRLNFNDIEKILGVIVNAFWFSQRDSISAHRGVKVPRFEHSPKAGDIYKKYEKEAKKAFEAIIAGQITSFLGITIGNNAKGILEVNKTASNLFYLDNGRPKRVSELVDDTINQLQNYGNSDITRTIIVNINPKLAGAPSAGKFMIEKLRLIGALQLYEQKNAAVENYGVSVGDSLANNITVSVSLGRTLSSLKKSSLI